MSIEQEAMNRALLILCGRIGEWKPLADRLAVREGEEYVYLSTYPLEDAALEAAVSLSSE